MKRMISFILSLVILCTMLPCNNVLAENDIYVGDMIVKSIVDSGTCGDNATWELYDDGELIISGSGEMTDWYESSSPFYQIRNYIKKVTINNGITSIGNHAFNYCRSLTNVSIPGSIKIIGNNAFFECSSLTSVTIPDGVTSIRIYAFFKCSSLTSVTISGSVTSIGDYTFNECSSLTNLTIMDGVKSIGSSAFSGCSSLTSVTIPDSVTHIDSCAFEDCSSLTSVTIPDSVTSIYSYSFKGCSSLTSVTIPDSVKSIHDDAFRNCSSLTNITVDALSQTYSSENGVLFNKNKTTLICCPGGKEGEYIIPDSVTSISWGAFEGCSNLTSITIPDSVTSSGASAFSGCSSLASITIPDSVTSIDNGAFRRCSSLTSVTIPDSVRIIRRDAFYGCSSLTSVIIPVSVTNIGYSAFCGCNKLTDVYYSGTKEQWNSIAIDYDYNENLTNATIHYNFKSYYTISYNVNGGSGAPANQTKNPGESLTLSSETPKRAGFTFLGWAVSSTASSAEYQPGDSFTTDSDTTLYAVWQQSKTVKASGTCGDNATWELYDDGELVISGSGTITEFYTNDSQYINKVTISHGITSIGDYAFCYRDNLTSVTIPDSVTSIGDYAFGECSGLTSITIPDSVTSISYGAFEGCSSLTSVTIPGSVTSIGNDAFRGCSSLTSVTIPDSVTSIGNDAFYGCNGLTSVTIPSSVTNICNAFVGCSIEYVYYNGTENQWNSIVPYGYFNDAVILYLRCGDNATWELHDDGELIISGSGAMTDWSYKLRPSRKSESPFSKLSQYITKVTISHGITSIGNCAFYYCNNLTSVTIPDSVTSIGMWAFRGCSSLTSVIIPDGVTSISNDAFYGCSSLTNITVDALNQTYSSKNGVLFDKNKTTLIYCPGGKSGEYIIPDSVTSISDDAFYGCSSLTNITVDALNQTYSSENGALFDKNKTTLICCPGGKSGEYIIPDSVTSISDDAFNGCSSLTSVTIPDSVTSIGGRAFSECSNLIDVYYSGTEDQWNSIAIGSNNENLTNATIHCIIKSYTISYNANGGSGAPVNQTKEHGESLTLSSAAPTKTGFTFLGWATSSTAASAEYQPGDSFTTDADTTLYAVWKINEYTISYNANGGNGAPVNQPKRHGESLTLSSEKPTKTGFTFLGWAASPTSSSAEYQPGDSFTTDTDTTLYAIWKINEYTISYNANSGSSAPINQTKRHGESLTLSSETPTKTGFTFLGWAVSSTAVSAEYQPGDSFIIDADTTLYAVWRKNIYTVTYNYSANGGSLATITTADVPSGDAADLSPTAVKSGWEFIGWNTDPNAAAALSSYMVTGDVTLYAIFAVINAAGITLDKSSLTLNAGESETLTAVIAPENATDKTVSWTSSNTSIATVSDGKVTAVGAGTAIITAATTDGGHTASCTVTVKEKVIDENAPRITISDIKTMPGKEIQVTVNLTKNTGFASLGIEVGYNSDIMTLTNAVPNSGVGGMFTKAQYFTVNPYNMGWDSAGNINYNGNLATLTFKVSENAPDGIYPITLDYYKGVNGDYVDGDNINYNGNLEPVGFVYISGNVIVASCIPGDINGDENIDNKDATYLLRYLAGWAIPDLKIDAIDVDGNASIDNKDATILLRYLAGWDVILH